MSSLKRVPAHDGIPAIAETLAGFDFIGWFVLVAPAGTPAEIVARMNRELDVALKDPEVVKRMNDVGVYSDGAETPAATAAYNALQFEAWGRAQNNWMPAFAGMTPSMWRERKGYPSANARFTSGGTASSTSILSASSSFITV